MNARGEKVPAVRSVTKRVPRSPPLRPMCVLSTRPRRQRARPAPSLSPLVIGRTYTPVVVNVAVVRKKRARRA